ncbi:MAG: hypothetical protein GVY17_01675 [Cyanobacteria bacterium]|jgi:hypothetical protein|nr:hypothetical protein [Cyanobacteria bacterium GSL.Bin21]
MNDKLLQQHLSQISDRIGEFNRRRSALLVRGVNLRDELEKDLAFPCCRLTHYGDLPVPVDLEDSIHLYVDAGVPVEVQSAQLFFALNAIAYRLTEVEQILEEKEQELNAYYQANKIPPSARWKRFAYWLRFGLVFFFCFFSLIGCSTKPMEKEFSPVQWQPAIEVAPQRARSLIEDYTDLFPHAVAPMQVAQSEPWQIFDFNLDGMCGSLGCFYVVFYDDKIVFDNYLYPNLPPGQSIWSFNNSQCLKMNQPGDRDGFVQWKTFCPSGMNFSIEKGQQVL